LTSVQSSRLARTMRSCSARSSASSSDVRRRQAIAVARMGTETLPGNGPSDAPVVHSRRRWRCMRMASTMARVAAAQQTSALLLRGPIRTTAALVPRRVSRTAGGSSREPITTIAPGGASSSGAER
jgi:hypothetical protein